MDWKKLGKAVLFPHTAILILLLPVATACLVYAMVFLESESILAILSYVLAAYTLTVWCVRMPDWIRFFQTFKNENRYARRWQDDTHLRVKISLYGTFLWNTVYAVFQLCLGWYHTTFWYVSLAGYYICLAVMRFLLVRHTAKNQPGMAMGREWRHYRVCGWFFLLMNLALTMIVFFMVYWNRTFHHHQITAIAMAAYTFTAFTVAIVNLVQYRKYNSPVYSASKAISFAAACVSMLTLESTMLTAFEKGEMTLTDRRILLGISGGMVCVFVIAMAIYMIVHSTKQLKEFGNEVQINGKQ